MVSKSKKPKVSAASSAKLKASPHLASKLESLGASGSSPLIVAAFSPQHLRTGLFACVIRGLDAQRLRIHDVTTSRLTCEHIFDKGVEVNSLSWGTLGGADKKKRKKRKRDSKVNGINGRHDGDHDEDKDHDENMSDDEDEDASDIVVAAATNTGKILVYSPAQGAVVKVLQGGHVGNVTDFKFSEKSKKPRGWSCDGDSLVEWDLKRGNQARSIALPKAYSAPEQILPTSHSVLCASHSIYAVDPEDPHQTRAAVSSHTSQVHSLLASPMSKSAFLSAAKGDRFVNVADSKLGKSTGSLVAQSDVESLAVDPTGAVLALVNSEGKVEVFEKPWSHESKSAQDSSEETSRRKKASPKTSVARIAVTRPSAERVKIVGVGFMKEEIVFAWVENGTNVCFAKLKWTGVTDDIIGIQGDVTISRAKSIGIGVKGAPTMTGAKDVGHVNIDQATAVVVDGFDTEDVGMTDAVGTNDEETKESDASGDEDAMDKDLAVAEDRGHSSDDDNDDDEDDKDELQEPSFAEKFQQLEVRTGTESSMDQSNSIISSKSGTVNTNITVPSIGDMTKPLQLTSQSEFLTSTSLTTVLTQALKTSDRALLETCLHTTTPAIITATIARLDSVLAVTLITKLAELISRKPGRAGSLMIWVETTFIYHGGHLLTIPDLVSKLASLQRVLGRRSASLTKMLALRGRLRMLVAQMRVRSMSRSAHPNDNDEGVVYVEGVNDDDDDESSDENDIPLLKGIEDDDVDGGEISESGSDEDDDMRGVNGALDSAEDDDGEGEEDDELIQGEEEFDDDEEDADGVGQYLDDEAEETSDDESDENDSFVVSDDEEIEYDEDDGDDDSQEEASKAPSKSKKKPPKSRK